MAFPKKLGLIYTMPATDEAPRRLVPAITAEEDAKLREAFLVDVLNRLMKLKNISGTIFCRGDLAENLKPIITNGYKVSPLAQGSSGEQMAAAFDNLLEGPNRGVVVIDSVCPDIPVQYIKRAYTKLKHKDVVLGPTHEGRPYLVGLKAPAPGLFPEVDWAAPDALAETVGRIQSGGLTLSVLPLWYRADTTEALRLLYGLIAAKNLEKGGAVFSAEKIIEEILTRER